MNTIIKTGIICAGAAVATGIVACGVISTVRVAKRKKALNYKKKVSAYKEAVKANTVTDDVKSAAEEAKAEVKSLVKHEMIDNAKCLVALSVVGFGFGFTIERAYEKGLADASVIEEAIND